MNPILRGRGLRPLLALGVLGALMLAIPGVGHADTFRVVNVPQGDELNVRAGPSVGFPVLGRLAREATGVEALGDCVDGWCPVRSGVLLGWANGRFLEAELSGQQAGGQAMASLGSVLSDGTLERSYPDGRRVRRLPSGTMQTVWPDGRVSVTAFVNAPGANLPALPSELSGWAGGVSDGLLAILGNILTGAEMQAYRQTETGKDLVELLDWRLRSIRFLTTPAS